MITLIIGLPNAGKTTYSEKFKNVIHFDECKHEKRMSNYDVCNKIAYEKYIQTKDVCVEGVYLTRKERLKFLQTFNDIDDEKILIYLNTPVEICEERERNFRQRYIGIVQVSFNKFENPTIGEGWDTILEIKYIDKNKTIITEITQN